MVTFWSARKMKLKKFLRLVSSDTKIKVIFEYEIVVKPCDYSKYEDLKVEQLRLIEGTDTLKVHISANGFFYNPEKNKYVKH